MQERIRKIILAADILFQRPGTSFCQTHIIVIRSFRRSISLYGNGGYPRIRVIAHKFNCRTDFAQFISIRAVVLIYLSPVHREVYVCRTFLDTHLHSLTLRGKIYERRHEHARLHIKCRKEITFSVQRSTAAAANQSVNPQVSTPHPPGIGNRCAIFNHGCASFTVQCRFLRRNPVAQMMEIAVASCYHDRTETQAVRTGV